MRKVLNKFKKVRTLHSILPEFYNFLQKLETHPSITRIIPARIKRQQKGTSHMRITVSYQTPSGRKLLIKKGSTAQEIFVICRQGTEQDFLYRFKEVGCKISEKNNIKKERDNK